MNNMTKQIGGWYRIGIVLSVIWVLAVSGIAIYECFRNRTPGRLDLVDDIGVHSIFGMTISQAFVKVASISNKKPVNYSTDELIAMVEAGLKSTQPSPQNEPKSNIAQKKYHSP